MNLWNYDEPLDQSQPLPLARPGALIQPGDRRPYFADAVFGDFDNDGWIDLVVLDRSENPRLPARAMQCMNRGDGTFELKPTTFSGLDGSGISGEAADLNNDGLLDLVFAADPDDSGVALSMAAYGSKVYWNTGAHGAKENHWLRLRFIGVKDAELIGAASNSQPAARSNTAGYTATKATRVVARSKPISASARRRAPMSRSRFSMATRTLLPESKPIKYGTSLLATNQNRTTKGEPYERA